ncbi:MAG: Stk1 family PASTA domain-containing Ser/Thr kinase [Egibacteraceae bacterium]
MDKTTARSEQSRPVLAGRYVLQGLLGQGGMADVELAFDQILDRPVAAKMLHSRYASDPSFLQRFRREAQAAASLNHPNVVAVYDTGDSDGRPFIVMEYVRGRSLRDVLRSEEILPERAAEIVGEAALALHYAHERGLVHRDVKPANIMISDDGQVKVADFGIARAVNADTVTQTAAVFGTAAYISPEQAKGETVDRRGDIYSLGVVLYEMLAHRPPFEGDSAVALAYKHVSSEPVPPSQLNPEVSPQLDAVVRAAMAKRPADRYQTARDLHDDLRRAVAGQRVSAPPPPPTATQVLGYADSGRTLVAPPYAPSPAPGRADAEAPYTQPRRRGSSLGWVLLALLILALFSVAGYFIWDLARSEPIAFIDVPDVSGLDLPRAQEVLSTSGFETRVAAPEASDQRQGTVLRTDPRAGDAAASGSLVTIIQSGGPIPIPDVSGRSLGTAEAILARAGLTVGGLRTLGSDTVQEGQVIGTDPPAGTGVGPSTEITLITSSGPSGITMPDVVGRGEFDASERVLAACPTPDCVLVEVQRVFSDDVEEGDVISTVPEAGAKVAFGDTITLVASDGPAIDAEPTPTPPPTDTPSDPGTPPPVDGDGDEDDGDRRPPEGLLDGLTRPN